MYARIVSSMYEAADYGDYQVTNDFFELTGRLASTFKDFLLKSGNFDF